MVNSPVGVYGASIDRSDGFCRHAADDRMRRHILCDDRARGDDRTLAHAHPVRDDGAGAKPDIIFDDDALRRDALLHERTVRVIESMVYGDDLRERRGVDPVTDQYTALPTDDGVFPDKAVISNFDAGVGHPAKVVHV